MKNQVVIITGSSRGIGKSIALELAKEGASVVVNGRDEKKLLAVVDEIVRNGGRAVPVIGAVENMSTGERLVETAVSHFGQVNVLINNAGIVRDRLSHRMSEEEWDEVIAVHLKGAFSTSKAFINEVKKQGNGGHIINMTSTAGLEGTFGQLNYSAAKAGILGMTWTLAKELAKEEIQVNAIAPAALTDMTKPLVERAERKAKQEGKELDPYWNIGSPDDVARFVASLLRSTNRNITGQVFSVNGSAIGRWKPAVYESLPNGIDGLCSSKSGASIDKLKSMIGKELYRVDDFPIERGKIREFSKALGIENPIYYDEKAAKEAGHRSIPAPLTYSQVLSFFNEHDFPFEELGLDLRYTLHGGQEYEYFKPIVAGDVLSAVCRIADAYEKHGSRGGTMLFLVLELEFSNQHGEKVLSSKTICIQTGEVVKKEL